MKQELLKFFGILILTTRYKWNDWADLWSKTPPMKYEVAPNFGLLTGMPRNRFDRIWKYIHFSFQPSECPPDASSEKYRWMLIDD
jgi:Transposase IS4